MSVVHQVVGLTLSFLSAQRKKTAITMEANFTKFSGDTLENIFLL